MAKITADSLRKVLPVLSGDVVPSEAARRQVREAGSSGDQSLRPLLRSLAGSITSPVNREVIYDALDGLWRLDEPKDYFLANARHHAENKWLAYFSILILGRDPMDPAVQPSLAEIAAASRDNQIRGAVAEYGRSRYLRQRYARFSKTASKVEFILAHFKGYWNPIFFAEGADPSAKQPEAAWLESALRELSRDHPDEVAKLICETDVSDYCPRPEMLSEWRRHMATLVAPAAGEALLALDNPTVENGDGL